MTPLTLTDWQARAVSRLKKGDRFLLVDPLKVQPQEHEGAPHQIFHADDTPPEWVWWSLNEKGSGDKIALPHAVGDRLWCREEWCFFPDSADGMGDQHYYRAAQNDPNTYPGAEGDEHMKRHGIEWNPADTMPQWASRFTLQVVSVDVKRLEDVTENHMRLAGASDDWLGPSFSTGKIRGRRKGALQQFYHEWRHQPPLAWADNPWCALTETEIVSGGTDRTEGR